jgi:hypothetical protein
LALTTSGTGALTTTVESDGGTTGSAKKGAERRHKTAVKHHTVLASFTTTLTRAGRITLRLHLPAAAHHTGNYLLHLVATSPNGKRHATTTLTLEIGS